MRYSVIVVKQSIHSHLSILDDSGCYFQLQNMCEDDNVDGLCYSHFFILSFGGAKLLAIY